MTCCCTKKNSLVQTFLPLRLIYPTASVLARVLAQGLNYPSMSNLSSYLKRVATALDAYDGASVARALSSDDSDVRQLAEARKIPNGPQLDMACGDALMQPYDEMVSQLLQRTDGAVHRPSPPAKTFTT